MDPQDYIGTAGLSPVRGVILELMWHLTLRWFVPRAGELFPIDDRAAPKIVYPPHGGVILSKWQKWLSMTSLSHVRGSYSGADVASYFFKMVCPPYGGVIPVIL